MQILEPAKCKEALIAKGLAAIKIGFKSKVPIEPWADEEHRERPATDFEGINIGIKCGQKLPCGNFLSILDIDPRHDGFGTLKFLQEEYDFTIPPTLTIETGGGGIHYYLKSAEPIRKCKLGRGLDWQGAGGYCVGPGSTHENGKFYTIKEDDEISEIPAPLLAILAKKQEPFFDGKTGHFSEAAEVEEGGRDDYLTKVAGALRRAGLEKAAIMAALTVQNETRCKPPLPAKDIERISKSICRYNPEDIEAATIPTLKPEEQEETEEKKIYIKSEITVRNFEKCFEMADGLIKDISNNILSHCDRQYKQFALASSMAIVATAAQGGHEGPPLGKGRTGGGLSAYFWLIAPSAAGKEAYRSAVETYTRAIDERACFDKFGSNYGLRSSLFCCNSGISIIDEFQDEMDRLGGKNSNAYLHQILTEMKELANDLKELKPVVLSKTRYPGVKFPRLSVFGLGTIEGFRRHLTGDVIGGGLLSRFSVVPVFQVPSRIFEDRIEYVPEEHLKKLQDIYVTGLTEEGAAQSPVDELEKFHSVGEKGFRDVEHELQHYPKSMKLRAEGSARLLFVDFYKNQEEIYKQYLYRNQAGSDLSPGSIADRAPRYAMKVACWHALGCGRAIINRDDAQFGILWAKTLADWLCDEIAGIAGENPFEQTAKKVLGAIKRIGGPASKREIHRATGNHINSKLMQACLETLCEGGWVNAIEKSTGRILKIEGNMPKKGLIFETAKVKLEK